MGNLNLVKNIVLSLASLWVDFLLGSVSLNENMDLQTTSYLTMLDYKTKIGLQKVSNKHVKI